MQHKGQAVEAEFYSYWPYSKSGVVSHVPEQFLLKQQHHFQWLAVLGWGATLPAFRFPFNFLWSPWNSCDRCTQQVLYLPFSEHFAWAGALPPALYWTHPTHSPWKRHQGALLALGVHRTQGESFLKHSFCFSDNISFSFSPCTFG